MALSKLDPYRSSEVCVQVPPGEIIGSDKHDPQGANLMDIEVVVETKVFPCQSHVLRMACPYFRAKFSFSQQVDGEKQRHRIELENLNMTHRAFEILLNFMIDGTLKVDMKDVVDVLMSANYLGLWKARELCAILLMQNINTHTCLSALVVGRGMMSVIEDTALSFVRRGRLGPVMREDHFTQLNPEPLASILGDPCLEVERETLVAEAILEWVRADPEQRVPLMPEMLQLARLTPLDVKELREKHKLTSSTDTAPLAEEEEEKMSLVNSFLDGLRESSLPSRMTEVIVAVSRKPRISPSSSGQTDREDIYFYCPSVGEWTLLTRMPFERREGFSVAVLNNKLYVTGGFLLEIGHNGPGVYLKKNVCTNHEEYDPDRKLWTSRQPMIVARFDHGAACLEGKLWVVGGQTATDSNSLAWKGERYDPNTDQWTTFSPLCSVAGVSGPGLATLCGELYLVGADNHVFPDSNSPTKKKKLEDTYYGVQVLDPITENWRELPALGDKLTANCQRLKVGSSRVVAVEGMLILGDKARGFSCHVYNPLRGSLDHWKENDMRYMGDDADYTSLALVQGRVAFVGCGNHGRDVLVDPPDEEVSSGPTTNRDPRDADSWGRIPRLPESVSDPVCVSLHLHLPWGRDAASSSSAVHVDPSPNLDDPRPQDSSQARNTDALDGNNTLNNANTLNNNSTLNSGQAQ